MAGEMLDVEHADEPKPELRGETNREVADPIVVVYELEEMADKTLRVGNSIDVPRSEAVLLIDQGKAKHAEHPIGVVPPKWA